MVSVIYDNALFLPVPNEEFKLKFHNRKPIDVASTVEHPKLYILGQSKSTDKDKLSYIEERLKNLNEISNPPIQCKTKGYLYDDMRLFSGDGPARQFEAGQQRGGHFSCICGIRANEHENLASTFTLVELQNKSCDFTIFAFCFQVHVHAYQ